jgi:hypothetical protein
MKAIKELFYKVMKSNEDLCKCKRSDRCTCPCHTNPGVMHIRACCSIKKCDMCNKDYHGK